MAQKEIVKAVKRLLVNDKRFLRLKEAFETLPAYNLNTDEIEEEILHMHESRKIRRLRKQLGGAGFIDEVVKALLQDQEIRSRLTEILVACLGSTRKLEEACKAFESYAIVEYSDRLSALGTKGERQQFIEACLLPFYRYLRVLEKIQLKARLVIEDIDKSAYTLKNTIEAVKLITHKSASV